MSYEQQALRECRVWQFDMMERRSSLFGRASKSLQNKINAKVPQKVHDAVTAAMKSTVKSVLYGSDIASKQEVLVNVTLKERERLFQEKLKTYKNSATAGGIGTGFGGLWWGLADLPLLLGIKMKFLYDAAGIYGYDIHDFRERIYMLHIFQVAFSSDRTRVQTFLQLRNWPNSIAAYDSLNELDWQQFQLEYRDHIDLAKLLQLIPGFGAIVGGVVNHRFLTTLGETTMNAYRMRLLDT